MGFEMKVAEQTPTYGSTADARTFFKQYVSCLRNLLEIEFLSS